MHCQLTDSSILINGHLDNNRRFFSVLVVDGVINSVSQGIFINEEAEISKFNIKDRSVIDQIKIV